MVANLANLYSPSLRTNFFPFLLIFPSGKTTSCSFFSINQLSPSLSALRYAIDLIEKGEQLVVFPEGKINRYGKKLVLKEGLYRLARLATKKTTSVIIIPIGIAYSEVSPKFRSEFCLSLGQPIEINDNLNFNIKEFNQFLNEKMTQEEKKALNNVGRWFLNKLVLILINLMRIWNS